MKSAAIMVLIALAAATMTGAASAQTKDVVDTALANPLFSTWAKAGKQSGMDSTLHLTPGKFTLFVPTNAAFAKMPHATLKKLFDKSSEGQELLTTLVMRQRHCRKHSVRRRLEAWFAEDDHRAAGHRKNGESRQRRDGQQCPYRSGRRQGLPMASSMPLKTSFQSKEKIDNNVGVSTALCNANERVGDRLTCPLACDKIRLLPIEGATHGLDQNNPTFGSR